MTGRGPAAPGLSRARLRWARWAARLGAVVLAGGLAAGCSEAWDTISRPLDPLSPADPETIEAPQEGAGEYPSLSSVPEQPPRRPSGRDERQQIQQSLTSDRANARYTGQDQTGEGSDARERSTGGTRAQPDGSGTAAGSGAPERPEIAEQMPADDAGEQRGADDGSDAATQRQARQTGQEGPDGSPGGDTAGSSTGGDTAPDVPQLQQSEQGEPIEVPAQPSFDGAGTFDRSGATGSGRTGRAQQQTARSGSDGASAPGPEVGRSRTFSRQDTGGQTLDSGGRRIAVIYFRHGSASLQGRDREVLRQVIELSKRQDRDLRVVGHASSRTAGMDPVDHRMANFDTSLKRAQAVVDALVSLGVPRDDIQLEARGDNEPVYHEFMPTGEAGNRRAEIFLQG